LEGEIAQGKSSAHVARRDHSAADGATVRAGRARRATGFVSRSARLPLGARDVRLVDRLRSRRVAASHAALQVAQRFAERLGVRLVLAHVVPLPLIVGYPEVAYAARSRDLETEDRAGQDLEQVASAASLGAQAVRRLEFGAPTGGLVAVAEEENDELIVVGSRRRGAWDAVLRGSLPHALASRATCPVLVVPAPAAKRGE
jgi:nucleotide-binding universal stress UspA family protein